MQCRSIPGSGAASLHGRFPAALKLRFGLQTLWGSTRWQPDLMICTHLALGPVGWLLTQVARRRCWIVVHGIEAWVDLPVWKGAALRRADRVIVTSAFSREQVVKRHHIHQNRISNLPCTLDETLLRVEPTKNGVCARVPATQRLVITVARMAASERYKGHDVVLRSLPSVVAKIPNLTYAIVGGGDDRPRLEALVGELGLGKHVIFTGEVADSELVALYRRSEVFLLPARTVIDKSNAKGEGFGIVFLEAMAFSKPVIGPNYGAPMELIRHGETGFLVDPENPAAVADALLTLLSNPDRAREMGKAGRDLVRRQYSYNSFCEKLRGIFVECLGAHVRDDVVSKEGRQTVVIEHLTAVLFVVWVIVINFLYYFQYKGLIAARFVHLLHRWH
ncbi:MAG: glycosyltransferase family 4 protein [Terriglobia bacterium]